MSDPRQGRDPAAPRTAAEATTAAAAPGASAGEEILYSEKYSIRGNDFEHGGDVAAGIKMTLRQLGLEPEIIRRLSIANFEAEMNVIMYADEGELELQVLPAAVRVVLADRGQGIPDIELAMQEGYSTATPEMRQRGFGAGLGLPNIKRNTDEFEITSTPRVGTTLRYTVRFPA
jgi:anti-sigma regulatory factor (Ser/Thr protein kinase)